jgi:V-type H+-transporting ATPase subunit D
LKVLITIASLQTQFVTLDLALKVTNRRVNALEFVQIPKILSIISWIDRELDEESREDFFRLKKVTDNKKELKLAAQEESSRKGNGQIEESKEEFVLPQVEFGNDSDEGDIFV